MRIYIILMLAGLSMAAQTMQKVSKGQITLSTSQKMDFVNLRVEEDKVIFTNVATKSEFTYFLKMVQTIEDASKNIVYGSVVEKKPQVQKAEEITDSLYRANYPEGIYHTREDFIAKKPSQVVKLVPRGLYGLEKPYLDNIEHSCFFYYTDNTKIKKVFAVSYKGHLYFQINGILANREKTDRAQTNDFPNSFVRVINGGENFLYTEADLANQWAKGFANQGGLIGAFAVPSITYGKGVVWDFKKREFNIFKNCNDYNEFIRNLYPEGAQDCKHQQPQIAGVRKAIEAIK